MAVPYITVQQVRDAGVPDPPDDATISAAIDLWQTFIDRATRQWFCEEDLELFVDGTDSDAMHFGIPIISIEEVEINMSRDNVGHTLDVEAYRVYENGKYPDHKGNPRIKLVDTWGGNSDIFTAGDRSRMALFRFGRRNQRIKGKFGCVVEGVAPPLIQRALLKLVIEKLSKPLVDTGDPDVVIPPVVAGIVKEEWTDGHKIKYETQGLKDKNNWMTGITNDPEIMTILRLFKAPIGVASVSASQSFR